MTSQKHTGLVMTQALLKPIGALCQAVIFAEIVLIKQRMNILKSRILEQETTINAAMSVLRLPPSLRRRITMYHQFLEIQHDEQACKLLYGSSSRALVLEVKICFFQQLIEKAPLFYDLKPQGVGELINSFEEEVFSPGDFVVREAQTGRSMYFILKGQCDVLINAEAGSSYACFSDISLLTTGNVMMRPVGRVVARRGRGCNREADAGLTLMIAVGPPRGGD